MAVNKKNKKRIPSRKLVFIILFLVILPIAFIIALYSINYSQSRISPFKDTIEKLDKTVKVEKIKGSDFSQFTFDFYCTDFCSESKDKVKFSAKAYDLKGNGSITNLKYAVQLGSTWVGKDGSYLTNQSSTSSTITVAETEEKANTRSVTLSNYNLKYPARKLLITKKSPTAYVYLTYTYTVKGESKEKYYLLSYSYKEYFINNPMGGIDIK